jgi:hypothetical protein
MRGALGWCWSMLCGVSALLLWPLLRFGHEGPVLERAAWCGLE